MQSASLSFTHTLSNHELGLHDTQDGPHQQLPGLQKTSTTTTTLVLMTAGRRSPDR